MKVYSLFLVLFISGCMYSQEEYSKEVIKAINGRWIGTEQRLYEWQRPVNREKEPLELKIQINRGGKEITIQRYFYFVFEKDQVQMVAFSKGHYSKNIYWTEGERIISEKHKNFYPGPLSAMPHYLFERGTIAFSVEGNKLILKGNQKIMERNEYSTQWKTFDFGVSRHFREKDRKGGSVKLKGGGPPVVPGGFFYKEPEYPLYSSEGVNRVMAEYRWYAEKKLTKREIRILQPYFVKTSINRSTRMIDKNETDSKRKEEIIKVQKEEIELYIFDNDKEDRDIVSVFLDGKLLASKVDVKKEAKKLEVKLNKIENIITIVAESEGEFSPNTAALTFNDGISMHTIIMNHKKGKSKTLKIIVDYDGR